MAGDVTTTVERPSVRHLVNYLAPATVLIYYLFAVTVSTCTLQTLKAKDRKTSRRGLLWLMALVLLSFVVDACMLLTNTFIDRARHSSTDSNVHALSNVLVWMFLLGCVDAESCVWYPHCGTWIITLVTEASLLKIDLSHGVMPSPFVYAQMIVQACRLLILVLLPILLLAQPPAPSTTDEESTPLLSQDKDALANTQSSKGSSNYGSVPCSSDGTDDEDEYDSHLRTKAEKRKAVEERLLAQGDWISYLRSFSMFVPMVWPTRNRKLQLNFFGLLMCLAAGRVLNVLEPRQFGIVLDRLNAVGGNGKAKTLVMEISLFVVYRWVDSVLIGPARRMFWFPIDLNAEKTLQLAAYNHVMDLSRDFHTGKQSGELYTSIAQGASITGILQTLLFSILPVSVDLVVAVVYLYYIFGPYMALILAATSMLFVSVSTLFLSKQTKIHRKLTRLSRKTAQIMYDSLGNWDTVCHFNTVGYEKGRYSYAYGSQLAVRLRQVLIFYVSYGGEDTIMELGLVGATILAVHQIVNGNVPTGNFAMLISYWGTFAGQLHRLMSTRREFLQQLIDAEALRELFQRKPTVKDGSRSLNFQKGAIHFHKVGFSYEGEKEVIKDLNLRAEPGQRVALVGETGGGKSTILKLLFRFYDPQKGVITIDGQNIQDVTLQSLRNCMGVVPQDPSLFNDTILQNVKYSKMDATDDEVFEACKAAAIHDKILQFPKGYASKVGEKGVKLSGGELQRIAIARVILMNPKIVLLDEATSAVDSETEGRIQEALQKLTHGRTTFTVAHRLSTVSDANMILVIKDGLIVEQGNPQELLKAKGKYFKLWTKQIGITNKPTEETDSEDLNGGWKATQSRDENRSSECSASSENKSLRATAPDFVPRSGPVSLCQRGTASNEGQSLYEHGASSSQQSHDSTTCKITKGKNKRQQEGKLIDTSDSPADITASANQADDGGEHAKAQRKARNPFPRRSNNKSEPIVSALKQSQIDGPSDGPSFIHHQSRRVSAPSSASSRKARPKEGDHGRKRRQSRRWRLQKSDSTAVASLASSREASRAWSGDTLRPTPSAPLNSPSTSITPKDEPETTGAGKASVQFAPGV